jgi:ABC-2 type transport system permease protein
MSTESGALTGAAVASEMAAPISISAGRRYYWSLRRELWEHHWLYWAPLGVAGLAMAGSLVGFTIHHARLPEQIRAAGNPMQPQEAIHYAMTAGAVMATTMIVAAYYCLDALYGERRDRSILFWKSLPVSDATTVLAKATVPVLLPVFGTVITAVANFIILLVSSAILAAQGMSVATLWAKADLVRMSLMLLYHMVTVHTLWWMPFFGWFLLVSAWARRAPIVWAVLPPLGIVLLEKLVFNSSHFEAMLLYRFNGGPASITPANMMPFDAMTHLTPGAFFSSAGLWTGLAFAAACIFGAIQLRRYSGPV